MDADGIASILDQLCYPVVVKAVSTELPHKSEAGAIKLGLPDAAAVHAAVAEIQDSVTGSTSEIRLENFLVESMVEDVIAELMIGINTDPPVRPAAGHRQRRGIGRIDAGLDNTTAAYYR